MSWIIDPFHTLVEFSVVHLGINIVKGRFKDVRGSIALDVERPEVSEVKVEVNTASIDTGMIARDAHLRSADFLEVAKYPFITFVSTSVQRSGDTRGTVTGNLTIRGITCSVGLQTRYTGTVRDPESGGWRIGFFATGIIDRRMFQIQYDRNAGIIGHDIRIELCIEAVQM